MPPQPIEHVVPASLELTQGCESVFERMTPVSG